MRSHGDPEKLTWHCLEIGKRFDSDCIFHKYLGAMILILQDQPSWASPSDFF